MKKTDIPQDKSALENFTKELCYAKDEEGKYSTALSEGWEVKKAALDNAWDNINEQIEDARLQVQNGSKSPIYYFMIKQLMTEGILASYSGIWKFNVKRHCKPSVFKKLGDKTLQKYADVFELSIDTIKNYKGEKE